MLLQQHVERFAEQHRCPSLAWGVVVDGVLAQSGGVGAVDEHTVFRIASMTKSFSCAATLIARDEGVLRLDDPIGLHVPELDALRSPTDDAPPITVRDLMTMTSGLVSDDAWADRHLDLTVGEFDRIVASGAVFAQPTGTAYEYSNFGYGVLGQVVHRTTGTRIQEHISDRLFAPLGLDSSGWVQPDGREWAKPMRTIDGRYVEEIATPGDGVVAPMGGIWSTVTDIARWIAWLDDGFPARSGPDPGPLRRASRREMQTAHRHVGFVTQGLHRYSMGYGYGVRVLHRDDGVVVAAHSGGFPGYGSNMRWVPGTGIGVITLANTTYAPMTALGAELMDLLEADGMSLRPELQLNEELRTAGTRLIDLLNSWDDVRAGDLFADNVEPDDSWDRRRAAADAIGPLAIEAIEAINSARACVSVRRVNGAIGTISFSLAPDDPHRIQDYETSVE